jgi:hypothetical protein
MVLAVDRFILSVGRSQVRYVFLFVALTLTACNLTNERIAPDAASDGDASVVGDGGVKGCDAAYCCTSTADIPADLICGVCNHPLSYSVVCQQGVVACDPMVLDDDVAQIDGYEVLRQQDWESGDGGCTAGGSQPHDGGATDAGLYTENMALCEKVCDRIVAAGCDDSIEGCDYGCHYGMAVPLSCIQVMHEYLVCANDATIDCSVAGSPMFKECDAQGKAANDCQQGLADGGGADGNDTGTDTGQDGGTCSIPDGAVVLSCGDDLLKACGGQPPNGPCTDEGTHCDLGDACGQPFCQCYCKDCYWHCIHYDCSPQDGGVGDGG